MEMNLEDGGSLRLESEKPALDARDSGSVAALSIKFRSTFI